MAVIPGRREAADRNPEKQEIPMFWIPGSCLSARPGMTARSFSAAC
jgi:hypothetical protein